jgi:hypothetical protein
MSFSECLDYDRWQPDQQMTTRPEKDPLPGVDSVTDLVMIDLQERREMGIKKYGNELQTHNGRDALIDAYQEALDLCLYLRQAIEEIKPRTE